MATLKRLISCLSPDIEPKTVSLLTPAHPQAGYQSVDNLKRILKSNCQKASHRHVNSLSLEKTLGCCGACHHRFAERLRFPARRRHPRSQCALHVCRKALGCHLRFKKRQRALAPVNTWQSDRGQRRQPIGNFLQSPLHSKLQGFGHAHAQRLEDVLAHVGGKGVIGGRPFA